MASKQTYETPQQFIDSTFPAYKSSTQLAQLHQHASRVLSELETEASDTTWKFEAAIRDLEQAKTKVSEEVDMLVSDVTSLGKEVTDVIQQDRLQAQLRAPLSSPAVQQWRDLDTIKQQMARVQQVFEEAKQFDHDKVGKEIDAKIQLGQLDQAVQLIDKYSALVYIWKGTQEHAKHHKFVTGLRKQVESALRDRTLRESAESGRQSADLGRASTDGRSSTPDTSRPQTPSSPQAKSGYYKFFDQIQRNFS